MPVPAFDASHSFTGIEDGVVSQGVLLCFLCRVELVNEDDFVLQEFIGDERPCLSLVQTTHQQFAERHQQHFPFGDGQVGEQVKDPGVAILSHLCQRHERLMIDIVYFLV